MGWPDPDLANIHYQSLRRQVMGTAREVGLRKHDWLCAVQL